jgi:mitochondrial fission protein ELM1
VRPSPYKLLLIKDRRPGHFRKSDGVAMALARHRAVSVSEICVGPPRGLPARLQRALISLPLPAAALLRLWGIQLPAVDRPDLVVSSGADTLAPNVLIAGSFGCANVFIGSVRGLTPERFTAVLTARPELSRLARHHFVLSPSPVDPDALRAPQPITTAAALAGRRLALLIGGPTSAYRFAESDWLALEALVASAVAAGASFEITSSRRTPDSIADRVAALAAGMPAAVQFVDYRRQRFGSIDPLFNADAILVTEDSNTMISEAVAARRPVVVLRPERVESEASTLPPLVEHKRVALLPMRQASAEQLVRAFREVRPLEENPLETLYALLDKAGVLSHGR